MVSEHFVVSAKMYNIHSVSEKWVQEEKDRHISSVAVFFASHS